ncbi:MAG: hypothetical protein QME52_04290 [Bacteroidota bacterium]|nr:hypothetical protein [Bacteroidota bacterium]
MTKLDSTGFPERIQRIEAEYRRKSGRYINVVEVEGFADAGNAVGRLVLENCVARIEVLKWLPQSERFETICHEMLHLELSLQGYPMLEFFENDTDAKNLVAHLESLLQHLLIMPIEKSEFGYDPYVSEYDVAESLYQGFDQLTNLGSVADPLWQFVHSAWGVCYARVATLASESLLFPKLTAFFKKPEMELASGVARDLQQLLHQSDLIDAQKYIDVLKTILDSLSRETLSTEQKEYKLAILVSPSPC